jgi:muconolactone delta-isomerase
MRFIVHLKIEPSTTKQEITELLPAEQARVEELKEQGILETFYLSHTMMDVWGIYTGDSLDTVQAAVESLPFYKFMTAEYTELFDGKI